MLLAPQIEPYFILTERAFFMPMVGKTMFQIGFWGIGYDEGPPDEEALADFGDHLRVIVIDTEHRIVAEKSMFSLDGSRPMYTGVTRS